MFHDDARAPLFLKEVIELGGTLPRRFCIQKVVIRKLFAPELAGGGDTRRLEGEEIKGAPLVRIFAIAKFLFEAQTPGEKVGIGRRKFLLEVLSPEIAGNERVIECGVGKCLSLESSPEFRGRLIKAFQDLIIIVRVHNDQNMVRVFRPRAYHRGTPNIYVLHNLSRGEPLSHRIFKAIEVHRENVNSPDVQFFQFLAVLEVLGLSQKASVNLRMQGFHPPA
jgi:hypothetical protein